ncbi:probable ATP-dependent helicase hrq1 [Coccomyxa sp. Obi]|nr:probable ATP-dependent helicase hrq1 [Coccomyxa sp. Obi]
MRDQNYRIKHLWAPFIFSQESFWSSGTDAARDTAAHEVPTHRPSTEAVLVSGGSPQPAGTPVTVSPSASESNFTLLPGYVSRPGPSPLKQPPQAPVPVISQGGFVAPSHVKFGDQMLAEAEMQGAKGPDFVRPTEGEDALWRELSEELKRVRELSGAAIPASVPVATSATLENPATEPVKKVRRTRQAVKSQHPASKSKDADSPADAITPAQSRLLAPVGTLTAAETSVVAELPLPPALNHLHQIFLALNGVYSFLLSQHIQATWRNVKKAVRGIPGAEGAQLADVEDMADLCPSVVILRNRNRQADAWFERRFESPRSVRHLNAAGRAASGASGSGSDSGPDAIPVNTANPAEIRTDGAGTVYKGEHDSFVIEIIDPGQRAAPAATHLADLGVDKDNLLDALLGDMEPGADARSLGDKTAPSRKQTQTQNGVNNANARRARAFRAGLVRLVALVHQRFLAKLRQQQHSCEAAAAPAAEHGSGQPDACGRDVSASTGPVQDAAGHSERRTRRKRRRGVTGDWDPLVEGEWHPDFPLQELELGTLKDAVREDEAQRRGSGSGSEEEGAGQNKGAWAGRGRRRRAEPRPPQLHRRHEPCRDTTPLAPEAFLAHLRTVSWYKDQIVHTEQIPARAAQYSEPAAPLSSPVRAALSARGVTHLFTHQAQAIDAARAGKHVVVCTSTASGKSLCYNLPILEALVRDPQATALYMFPTKALAQDQLRALKELCAAAFGDKAPCIDIYDGDTPQADRGEVRERAHLLITNPDMLHCSILPVHRQFSRFLANLHYVVVDEGHAYRGVFGCHAALVLRRLQRICQREYRRDPRFMVASATIANPQEHIQQLLGVPNVHVVSEDGSPHGPKSFVMWNPPLSMPPPRPGQEQERLPRMSHTEGRTRQGNKRKQLEWLRSKLQESEQARGAGIHLGAPGAGVWSPSDSDWLSAARMGRRRRAVAGTVLADASGMEPALAVMAAATAKDTTLSTLSKLLSPPKLDDGGPSDSDADDAEAHLQPYAADQMPAAVPSKANKEAPRNTGCSTEEQARLQALVQSTVVARPQVSGPQKERSNQDYMHDPDNPPRPLLKRRTVGLQELTTPAAPAQPAGEHPSGAGRGAGVVSLATETPEQRDVREEVQARLPGKEWRERHGAAGVPSDERRGSPIVELSLLLAECVQHGLRTIAFCNTRKLCELVTAYTRETLKATAPDLASSISVYRAGYSPQERREIEGALFSGKLWAVAATNALELGVDVGSLDATLHLGFPGSVASMWQQAGRAGRREQPSVSIYIGFDGPLDQFFMHQPENLFKRPIETAQIDPENEQLLQQHLACAAAETPLLLHDDQAYFGARVPEVASFLQSVGLLNRHPHASSPNVLFYVGSKDNPARQINLRAIDPERYTIVNEAAGDEVLEEIEESKAFFEVYDGAVYLYQGRTYLCKKLDLSSKVAVVRPADLKYYTKTRDFCDVHVIGGRTAYAKHTAHGREQPEATPSTARCDECQVTTRWLGFYRVWQGSGEVFDTVDLFLPDVQFNTQAAYIRVPQSARTALAAQGLPFRDGLHAASHALVNVLPLFLLCNATDLGTECDNPYDTRFRPERLLVYDKHPGGIGLAKQVRPLFPQLLRRALELIRGCDCRSVSGCPACTQHMGCTEYNAVLHKHAAIVVLELTLAAEVEYAERLQGARAYRGSALDGGHLGGQLLVQGGPAEEQS